MVIRDSASLIILDLEEKDNPKILMGKRHNAHNFLPNCYVFPGGKLDRADFSTPYNSHLHPIDYQKLLQKVPKKKQNSNRPQALGIAALRECYEETGIFIGSQRDSESFKSLAAGNTFIKAFVEQGLLPDLSKLTFFCRAITPPISPKRYDTRFFITQRSQINHISPSSSDELEDVHWVSINDAKMLKTAYITMTIINLLKENINRKIVFDRTQPSPLFMMRYGKAFTEYLNQEDMAKA